MIRNLTYAPNGYRTPFFGRTLTLGTRFLWNGFTLRFVKVPRKGFNFLVEDSNECLLNGHLYCRVWANREIPKGKTKFHIDRIPYELKNIKELKE